MSDADNAKTASTATFVTALVFNAIVFGAEIVIFTLVRPHFKAIYEPRTYVPPKSRRIGPLTPSFRGVLDLKTSLSWPWAVFMADPEDIKRANGLDAYFFVRFLRMMVKVFLPIWLISWAVLLPVTSVGTGVPGHSGLDKFIFGNVASSDSDRYAAHLILMYLFTGWVFYNIYREMGHFVTTRHLHLIDPAFAKTVQANTVLITGIPAKYLTYTALRTVFDPLPGGVKTIWINRNLGELPDVYDRRLELCNKLEGAETKLLGVAANLRMEELKEREKAAKGGKGEKDPESATSSTDAGPKSISDIPESLRPTHKLGFLGLFGEKVDTINWCREEIKKCTDALEEGRSQIPGYAAMKKAERKREKNATDTRIDADLDADSDEDFGTQHGVVGIVSKVGGKVGYAGKRVGGKVEGVVRKRTRPQVERHESANPEEQAEAKDEAAAGTKPGQDTAAHANQPYPPLNAAFITFNRQISAHLASQALVHHDPYRMSQKHLSVSPSDVIWGNLGLNEYEMRVRFLIGWGITAALIIFWAIPVAFVGIVSNIYTVCSTASWLGWICRLPSVVVGIISGILPPVLLAVLMALLPIVLRLLASFSGIPKKSGVELSLMDRFFMFQVVHSFLVMTLSAGIVSSLNGLINDPASTPSILAQNLPLASNFFLTYIILQGLSGTAGGFLQAVPLVIYYVKLYLLGSTPRSVYQIKFAPPSVAWGTLFPSITLLTVITLSYSIISPIINGLAWATFFLFYLLYKYLFLWVYDQTGQGGGGAAAADTGGLFFPKAIGQTFVGIYLSEICLAALFFLAQDDQKKQSAVPEGALMVVLIVVTIFFQMTINNSYGPLIHALPLTLVEKMYSSETPLSSEEDVAATTTGGGRSDEVEMSPVGASRTRTRSRVSDDHDHDVDGHGAGAGPIRHSVDSEGVHLKPYDIEAQQIQARSPNATTTQGTGTRTGTGAEKDDPDDPTANLIPTRPKPRAEEEYGFAHPAASRPQRTIWIPRDNFTSLPVDGTNGGKGQGQGEGKGITTGRSTSGLAAEEELACLSAGVDASIEGAEMNEKGKVDLVGEGQPPERFVGE
ncbi:hypothetical protein D9758_003059 [Tetrapyrgos nigripes]|uniref:DUF221-domain-containing protein n=1 Tax=Tetrapyrgos nigripes TaxID=182062 RepID=A0A8H5GQ89_9AGAR|nr:hypothetical protein D9758_003059 [Tetrapyrgos nigripes]